MERLLPKMSRVHKEDHRAVLVDNSRLVMQAEDEEED
jgi:hypothetical protein